MKKTWFNFAMILCLTTLLCSCKGLVPNLEKNSFSYNFSENGCSTGDKNFSSNDAMCNALKNDSLNNYCAQSQRYQKFQSSCPGKVW